MPARRVLRGSCSVCGRVIFDHMESSCIFSPFSSLASFLSHVVLKGKLEGSCHCQACMRDPKLCPERNHTPRTSHRTAARCTRDCVGHAPIPAAHQRAELHGHVHPKPGAHGVPLNPKDITYAPVLICQEIGRKIVTEDSCGF